MYLAIFSLVVFSDFVHSENKSYNFTTFCNCPSYGVPRKSYCGHEISAVDTDCMTHALYKCINGPNKATTVLKYCENSRCGKVPVGNRFTSDCMDLFKEDYFEGCWFPKLQDGYKYAGKMFYYDTIRDDDMLFHIFRRTGKNTWVNTTFRR
ncbi:uncharacterized protein LOC118434535 [Folsomia candida]|nr:uncharacterized protein LOC118434535 [Folsomia candida]